MKASFPGRLSGAGSGGAGLHLNFLFTLSGPGPLSLLRRQVNEVLKQSMSDAARAPYPTNISGRMIAMNMSMTERIKAGKLFTVCAKAYLKKDFVEKR